MVWSRWLLAGVVATVAGCDCQRGLTATMGEVRWEQETADGTVSGERGLVDFGTVSMGESVERELFLHNVGRSPVTLGEWTAVAGDAVAQNADVAGAVFSVTFEPGAVIAVGERAKVTVRFTPPIRTDVNVARHRAELEVAVTGAGGSGLVLVGEALSGECEVPATLDFGSLQLGSRSTLELDLSNRSVIDVELTTGAVTGDAAFSSDRPAGTTRLMAGASERVRVTFAPSEARVAEGTFSVRRSAACPAREVRLRGTGVVSCLSWSATPPDDPRGTSLFFGFVAPQQRSTGSVVFSNACQAPVRLSGLETRDPVFPILGADPMNLEVPASARDAMGVWRDGTATLSLEFRPLLLGTRNGSLRGMTSLSSPQTFSIRLRGVGGGPRIEVRPTPLTFGRVGRSPGAFATRQLRLANIGTRPTPADARANLKLGRGAAGPWWTLRAIEGDVSELCVGEWDAMANRCSDSLPRAVYDPAVGLTAATGVALFVPIRLTPSSVGPKSWELTIHSNDAQQPDLVVPISAEVLDAPPCNLEVTPGQLSFGLINQPDQKEQQVLFRNLGTGAGDLCYLNGIELAGSSDGTFTLPQGPVPSAVLMPGQILPVTVRAMPLRMAPMAPLTVRGALVYSVNRPGAPTGDVQLTATLAPTCVTISPAPLDFPSTELECGTPALTVSITNTCATPIVLNSVTLTDAAVVPMGIGTCAQGAGCPQFGISAAAMTGVIGPGNSQVVQVRFRPYELGTIVGALEVAVAQGGQPVSYPVTLIGSAVPRAQSECAVTTTCPDPIIARANSQVALTPAVTSAGPVSCAWSVVSRPSTASGAFSMPMSCAGTSYFADVVGTHVVSLTASDGLGGVSSCTTPITITPNGDLWIELTWDQPNDLDLHLLHPMAGAPSAVGSWGNSMWDCNYRQPMPMWGSPQQNPTLDRDDTMGRGPENIRIDRPQSGLVYTIGAHLFRWASQPTKVNATMRLYCGGQLVTTRTEKIDAEKDLWVVGRVQFPAGMGPCQFTPDGTVLSNVP